MSGNIGDLTLKNRMIMAPIKTAIQEFADDGVIVKKEYLSYKMNF